MSGVLKGAHGTKQPTALFEFTQGIEVDRRMAAAEVKVQKAWAQALVRQGRLSTEEGVKVEDVLTLALEKMEAGSFEWRVEDEDIHMNLERFMTEQLGALGKKIHEGRSRNDLVATTLRVFVASTCDQLENLVRKVAQTLLVRAEKDLDHIVPGLTHVQHAQPVRMGFIWASHAAPLARDLERVRQTKAQALAHLPLGAAAMAGTTVGLDFAGIAKDLGFKEQCLLAYDAVSDRDFMLELLSSLSMMGTHLSRLSEDCIYWSSSGIGLLKLPNDWSTGSSIMPNKRNPDVAELCRAKSAHLLGCIANGLALVKGLPTSYNSDLHELKQVVIRAIDEATLMLQVLPPFLAGLEIRSERAAALLKVGHLLATEVANELARRGVPFREAYAKVSDLVKAAEERKVQIEDLSREDFKALAPELDEVFLDNLSAELAVELRRFSGGTARAQVLTSIAALRKMILA